ncbi:TolC family protein [Anoxybacterium hadale]|uniref:TolC family protein n=1 Tax=Anoxybacterium hadale TaxID=3408580 RepID=A0ACD1AF25_9FIRM|nr:TolC family protein [Clostridiales bacterium]
MKKILCTSLVLLLMLSGVTAVFAEEAADQPTTAIAAADTGSAENGTTPSAVTVVPDMNFTGTPVKLSLEDAYKKMLADSPGAKMADLNRQSADGVAKGYGESVQKINKARDALSNPSIPDDVKSGIVYDSVSKDMAKLSRDYATTQGSKNYESEINALKTDTFEKYYTLKEMETQKKIAADYLALSEKLLSNTQLKYKLGTVSKNDVLKAEISVNEAKDNLLASSDGLNALKMGFNQFMGYDLMQTVTLSDEIKEVPLSTTTLASAIKSALANRNEISGAKYLFELAKLNLEQYAAYPRSSSKYIAAQMECLQYETGYKNAPLNVERDVRTKYMEMNQKYSAVQTGKKTVENAKESERLAQLQYDSGLSTLADVQGAQVEYYKAQLAYSKALLEYNLAVDAYNLSSGVGIEPARI